MERETPDTQTNDDLFDWLLREPDEALRSRWTALGQEHGAVVDQQRELTERREDVEARQAVVKAIAQFRKLDLAGPSEARESAPVASSNGRGTAQSAALEMLDAEPERIWDAASLHKALRASGVETTLPNVRIILQRAFEQGRARRPRKGRYQSANASTGTLPGVDGGEEK